MNARPTPGATVDKNAAAREQIADRLLTASIRMQFDPLVEIDWDAPLDPDRFWLPPHRSSLYGTELWSNLTHRQRVELTKHEVASAASAGLWFETILTQMLIREYYDSDPTTRHAQYALTEIADECRHSIMFGRLIERAGCPFYPATRFDHLLGRLLKATAHGAHMYAAILIAEEILDRFQREIMADDSLQPLIRQVSRIHVIEEARHIRYARAELPRQLAQSHALGRAYTRLVLGRAAHSIAGRLVHPQAYAAVGIDPRAGRQAAQANPHFQATMRWSAERIVKTLDEHRLIAGPGKLLWRHAALIT